DRERRLRPRVAWLERDLPAVGGIAAAVAEPVLNHELDPRRGEQVERLGRDELAAGEELTADGARVRLHQHDVRLRRGGPERYVAAEARAEHAHPRLGQVVVDPELGAVYEERRVVGRQRRQVDRRLAARVVEVLLA